MTNAPRALPLVQRSWVLLTQFALFLPFVTARGCGDGKVTDYTGIALYAEAGALLLPLLAVATLPLLVGPWRGGPTEHAATDLGLRAWFAGFGTFVAFAGPHLALLFDDLTPRVGYVLHVVGWAALYAAYLVGSAAMLARVGVGAPTGRVRAALVALGGAPLVALLLNLTHNDPGTAGEIALSLAFGWGMTLPLVVSGLGLARVGGDPTTHRAWWLLVLLTLAAHVGAAAAD